MLQAPIFTEVNGRKEKRTKNERRKEKHLFIDVVIIYGIINLLKNHY